MKHEPQRYRVYNVGSRPQANQHFILDIFPGSCLLFVVPRARPKMKPEPKMKCRNNPFIFEVLVSCFRARETLVLTNRNPQTKQDFYLLIPCLVGVSIGSCLARDKRIQPEKRPVTQERKTPRMLQA